MIFSRHRLSCLLVVITAFLSCSELPDPIELDSKPQESFLSLGDAEDIFQSDPYCGGSVLFNTLQLGVGRIIPDWDSACYSFDVHNANDNLEVRFSSQYSIQFYEQGRNGRRNYLDSDKRVILVRNRESGQSGAFVMILIADADYTRKHRKVELDRIFHNDGKFRDYSGVILYTTLSGQVVRANRYKTGTLVSAVLLSGSTSELDFWQRMYRFRQTMGGIRYMRRESYVRTRSYSDSTDADLGWPYDDTLDPAVCVADTNEIFDSTFVWPDPYGDDPWEDPWGGSGGSGGGGGDYLDQGPDPGSGHYGGGGVDHFPSYTDYDQNVTIGNKQTTVHFESESLVQPFLEKLTQLNAIPVFQRIISRLDLTQVPISVKYANNFDSSVSGRTCRSYTKSGGYFQKYDCCIELNADGLILGYLEEFFHALQFTTATHELMPGDVEFEAKVVLARFLAELNMEEENQVLSVYPELGHNQEYFHEIYKYVLDPTEGKRVNAINAFIRLGYLGYPMSADGSNLNQILNLYRWLYDIN